MHISSGDFPKESVTLPGLPWTFDFAWLEVGDCIRQRFQLNSQWRPNSGVWDEEIRGEARQEGKKELSPSSALLAHTGAALKGKDTLLLQINIEILLVVIQLPILFQPHTSTPNNNNNNSPRTQAKWLLFQRK